MPFNQDLQAFKALLEKLEAGDLTIQSEVDQAKQALSNLEKLDLEKVLRNIVSSIYFNDSSKYPRVLWQILLDLDPDLAALAQESIARAYNKLEITEVQEKVWLPVK